MNFIIAPLAQGDIVEILDWTEKNFGPRTMGRYRSLIRTAIDEVASNPELAGSTPHPEVAPAWRTYHLFHSRKNSGPRGQRIRNPRHLLLYRVTEDNVIEIARVLHDSMELTDHLPMEFRDEA